MTPLTLVWARHLPAHARRCVFWEIDPALEPGTQSLSDPHFEKEAWLSMVMLEWGSCGQIAVADGKAIGCALYAPPGAVPRAEHFPTSPVSPDAVLLTTLSVGPGRFVEALADRLVTAVVTDLVRRGVRALEAFGIRKPHVGRECEGEDRVAEVVSDCSPVSCMIDADFLTDVGFEIIAPHHRFPRLRLELDHRHDWKIDVEHALDQLLVTSTAGMLVERLDPLAAPQR